MKYLIVIILLSSLQVTFAANGLSYKVDLPNKVISMDEILLQDITQLYSELYFSEELLADKTESKREKKIHWADKLRNQLKNNSGQFRI